MWRSGVTTLLLLILGAHRGTSASLSGVVVNEIMYAPSSPEPEWIEIANRGTEQVNLKNWLISDATASRHMLPATDIILPAGGYLLLTKDSTMLHSIRGVTRCAVVSVTGFPSLNNGGDAVLLFDALGRTVDSVVYRPEWGGNEEGHSLERRDVDAPSLEPGNWGSCTSAAGATPGLPNSIVRRSYDLSVAAAFVPADVETVIAIIRNEGKLPAVGYALEVYDDMDLDSVAVPGEMKGRSMPGEVVLPADSVRLPCPVALSPGFHHLIAIVDFPGDERPENNQVYCKTVRPFPTGALVVNEIMARPVAGGSEYVELANTGDCDIDVNGWTATDMSGSAGNVAISSGVRIIHPGEFLVLAGDSVLLGQFPALANIDPRLVAVLRGGRLALNNDVDAVVIHDALNVTIDSVTYCASWHNPDLSDPVGRSLERIHLGISSNDPRNWGTSIDPAGGTPGKRNSISVQALPAASRLSCAPNPFSPDADGIDDVIVIHYEMPIQASIINLKVYDIRGRLVRRLASNEPGGPVGNIIWDGRDDTGAIARIGIYIALLEAVNSNGALESAKGILVLARRL